MLSCSNPLLDLFSIPEEHRLKTSEAINATCGNGFQDNQVCCSEEFLNWEIEEFYHQSFVFYAQEWKYFYSLMNYIDDLQEAVDHKITHLSPSASLASFTDSFILIWDQTKADFSTSQQTCFQGIFKYVEELSFVFLSFHCFME